MNAVGIDASKGKSMVTILRPFGEIVSSPHEVKHTSDQIDDLVDGPTNDNYQQLMHGSSQMLNPVTDL